MSSRLIALLVASALVAGIPHAGAAPKNTPPLNPGGAAGIQAAQGASDRGTLIASGLILAAIVAALLLIEDDDEGAVSSTGTD